ncbi:cystathionine gamma-synthase [Nocardioides sp. Kera G14]|uniref:cystathionine gamma-synthase n=1 Tax=Nocardioides sp. Kera G14 TaxID=2884264 RepID=UPI001D1262DC|nr:cystathionine gamma-synthase [Nocardioides sp. Kera G14]UDY24704.1 cystathionine gamma-synthase [Nocardioides sp. Kera G14]
MTETPGFSTRAIHAGQEPDPRTGAVNVPIYASSTFAQDGVGGLREGFEYARTGNPTRRALETAIAALEGGTHGRAFSSGMAATDAALRSMLRPGDHLVIPNDAYGGTFRLIDKVLTHWGITYSVAPVDDPHAIAEAITPETKVVWIESPTNPLLNVADIAAVAEVAHNAGAKLVVDNTFATPYYQQPLALGADVVLHSTTKYLGGHSDVVGGALVTDDPELDAAFGFLQNGAGGVPSPFDVFLTLRGLKTLSVRMDRHTANAAAIVELLQGHESISEVRWPGYAGMVSIRLSGGREAALDMCKKLELFTLAESLGGVESLVELPAAMTHASTAGSLLEVPDDLVRLSVGIEDVEDLLEDLRRSLR